MGRMVAQRIALACAALALASCNNNGGGCTGEAITAAQIGKTLHVSGNFQNGQPVMTLSGTGFTTVIAATTNTGTDAEFDLTGVPTGAWTATWEISCFDGSGTHPFKTNRVPTVTVQ